jgi:hypothetical protein
MHASATALSCAAVVYEPRWTRLGQALDPGLGVVPHDDGTERRTADKYSNAIGRERLREAATERRPAPTTTNDLDARSSHRGAVTPTADTNDVGPRGVQADNRSAPCQASALMSTWRCSRFCNTGRSAADMTRAEPKDMLARQRAQALLAEYQPPDWQGLNARLQAFASQPGPAGAEAERTPCWRPVRRGSRRGVLRPGCPIPGAPYHGGGAGRGGRGLMTASRCFEDFKARVEALGGEVLEATWLGSKTPHHVRCVKGHDSYPAPSSVKQGGGICKTCAGKDPKVAEAAFKARLIELSATFLEPVWLGTMKPHHVQCSQGHDCYPAPHNVIRGRGICLTCAGTNPAVAEANFRARLGELGATLLEPEYLGNKKPHHVLCARGHDCHPIPGNVQRGQGICATCAGHDPAVAEAAFRARLTELGAALMEPYRNARTKHHVICAQGHDCHPLPTDVNRGQGICRTCAGLDPKVAAAGFKAKLTELDATLLEPYKGCNKPHHVRCANGHDCYPWPTSVKQGRGVCKICAGRDPETAEANFLARLAELGATPLYENWQGSRKPHHIRCAEGHNNYPTPNSVQRGNGICWTCGNANKVDTRSAPAWAGFRTRVEANGGVILEAEWLGSNTPHRVRCSRGHECSPIPGNVLRGQGICGICAGRNLADPDVFYVVTGPPSLKLGVTRGDPNGRLGAHRSDGYTKRIRLFTVLPEGVARTLELRLKRELPAAGYAPVRGTEYFNMEALPLVLNIVDAELAPYTEGGPTLGTSLRPSRTTPTDYPGSRSHRGGNGATSRGGAWDHFGTTRCAPGRTTPTSPHPARHP